MMQSEVFYMCYAVVSATVCVNSQEIELEAEDKSTGRRIYYTFNVDFNNSPCNRHPDQVCPNQLLSEHPSGEPRYFFNSNTGLTTRSGTLQVTEAFPLDTVVSFTYWKCPTEKESSCRVLLSKTYFDFCNTIKLRNKPWTALVSALENSFPGQCPISVGNFSVRNELLGGVYFETILEEDGASSLYVRRRMEWIGNGKVLLCVGTSGRIFKSNSRTGSYKVVK